MLSVILRRFNGFTLFRNHISYPVLACHADATSFCSVRRSALWSMVGWEKRELKCWSSIQATQ